MGPHSALGQARHLYRPQRRGGGNRTLLGIRPRDFRTSYGFRSAHRRLRNLKAFHFSSVTRWSALL